MNFFILYFLLSKPFFTMAVKKVQTDSMILFIFIIKKKQKQNSYSLLYDIWKLRNAEMQKLQPIVTAWLTLSLALKNI